MHLRQNAATREWVLFAPERARRPEDYHAIQGTPTHERPTHVATCPFCPGGEDNTPGETLRFLDDRGAWVVRAFPNRYPAIVPEGTDQRIGDRFHRHVSAYGHHEVVAESPLHNQTLALMGTAEIELVLRAWQERVRALWTLTRTDHVVLFKNHGPLGGTSLEHPHSQLVSLPVAPVQVRHRTDAALRYFDDYGHCVYCKMLEVERADQARLVSVGEQFSAFVPYAAFSPYSVWIVPHQHRCCFSHSTPEELQDLAVVLRDLLRRFYYGLHDPSYNLVLRLPSREFRDVAFYHYYFALVPRLGKAAGFEMGTGMFINTSLPELDAAFLRGLPEI